MERGLTMLLHSMVLGFILFLFMYFVLGQSLAMSEDRSVTMGSVILLYMMLFGHGLPMRINKNIM